MINSSTPSTAKNLLLVAAQQVRGSVDQLTAYLLLERQLASRGTCALVVPVFDGSGLYNLRFTDINRDLLTADGHQNFAGPAQLYEVVREEIAANPNKNEDTYRRGKVQLVSDSGNAAALVFFLFDLLYLDGEDLRPWPLIERKDRLRALLANVAPCLHYGDHVIGQGPAFYEKACAMHVEGIVSKRIDAPYTPGNRGLWRKVKCLNRAEFVVVGWTEPEGRRPFLGALLLANYDPGGKLIYAGRAGTGMNDAELELLWRPLQPLATDTMPLDVPPPRGSRFGSPLVRHRGAIPGDAVEVLRRVSVCCETGILEFRKGVRGERYIVVPAFGERKHANSDSGRLAQCRAVRILKQGAWNVFRRDGGWMISTTSWSAPARRAAYWQAG